MSDNKYKKLGYNSLLVFVGNLGGKVINLLMLPLYTSWLSVADYGTTDIINVYATFLLSIVSCCIAESIFIFPANKTIIEQKSYFTSGLIFSVIAFCLTALLFTIVLYFMELHSISNSFSEYGWFIFFVVIATFFQQYTQQFTRSINKIKIYAFIGIISTLFIALFSLLLIPKFGVIGYIDAMVLSYFLAGSFAFISIKGWSYIKLRLFSKTKCKQMLYYSIPLIPNATMWWLIGSLNRPIMENYLGLDDVGLYAVANKFPSLISLIFSVFLVSWQISVLDEFHKKGYHKFYNKVARIIFFILTLSSCILTVLSKFIIEIAADDKFIEAWRFMPIMAIAALFSSFGGFVGQNFSAVKVSKYFFYSSVWGAVSSVVFNFLFIPQFGLYGAALAFALSYAVMAVSRYLYSKQYVIIDNLNIYIIFIGINILLYLISIFVHNLILKFIIYGFSFALLLWLNKDIISQIPRFIQPILSKLKKYY